MIDPPALQTFIESDRVTDKEREAVQLVFIQGYGFVRAAELLGISPRTVRDSLDRVRRRLRTHDLTPHPNLEPGLRAFALWLHQRQTRVDAELHTGHTPNDPRPAGDAHQLRGIPVIGVEGGIGGCYPADRPGHEHAVRRADESVRIGSLTYRHVRI